MGDRNGYIGRSPSDSSVIVARQTSQPTGVQTNFVFNSGYNVGLLDVYINGSKLINALDYQATDTRNVILTTPAVNGDVIEFVAYKAFNITQPVTTSDTLDVTGAINAGSLDVTTDATIGGNLSVTGDIQQNGVGIVTIGGDGSTLTGIVTTLLAGENIQLNGSTGSVTITGLANTANVVSESLVVSGLTTTTNEIEIRSNDGTPARIDYYCEVNNAHRVRLQAPPHAQFSGNPTVVLPNTSGTLLLSDGDGSNLTGVGVGVATEGGIVGTAVTLFDFRGSGISTVTFSSGIATIFIEGGTTLQPPVINSVGLTTTAGANRFTSQDFTVATTMVNDGIPVSQKSIKSTVTSSQTVYKETDTISNSTTNTASLSFALGTNIYGSMTSADVGLVCTRTVSGGVKLIWIQGSGSVATQSFTSTDGGSTWGNGVVLANNLAQAIFETRYFEETNTIVICRNSTNSIYSLDGGESWSKAAGPGGSTYGVQSVSYDPTTDTYVMSSESYGWIKYTSAGQQNPFVGTQTQPINSSSTSTIHSLVGGGGYHCGIYEQGSSNAGRIIVSESPVSGSWTTVKTLANGVNGRWSEYHDGVYYIADSTGTLHVCSGDPTQGSNWTTRTLPTVLRSFGWSDDGVMWGFGQGGQTPVVSKSTNNGISWTTVVSSYPSGYRGIDDSDGGFAPVFAAGQILYAINQWSNGTTAVRPYSSPYKTTDLTFSSNTNLGGVNINVGDGVRANGVGNVELVSAVNASNSTMTVGASGFGSVGQKIESIVPVPGGPQSVTKYLVTDGSGNVSDLTSVDPGFVQTGPGTSVTLSLPATFSSTGNAPDTDLPAGASIRAEVQATNSQATDTELSNIVTPT